MFLPKQVKHQKSPTLQITLFDESFCYLLNNISNKAAEVSQMQQNATHHINYLIKNGNNCQRAYVKSGIWLSLLHILCI